MPSCRSLDCEDLIDFEVGCYTLYARMAAAARTRFEKPLVKEVLMKFEDLGLAEPLLRRCRAGLPRHHQDSSRRHSAGPRRARRAGLRTDRNRQDGRVRFAHLAATQPGRVPRQRARTEDPHAGARAHARTGTANLREFPGLWPLYGRAASRDLRRRGPVAASSGLEPGRGRVDRHPGTIVGPDAARLRGPVARRGADPRRGRSDARHGLYPRSAADCGRRFRAGGKRCCSPPRCPRPFGRWPTNG